MAMNIKDLKKGWVKMFGKTSYSKKKRVLIINCPSLDIAKLIQVIAGDNSTRSGRTVKIDVSKMKDAEQALAMIAIVDEIK